MHHCRNVVLMVILLIALIVTVGIVAPLTILLAVYRDSFVADALAAARALLRGA